MLGRRKRLRQPTLFIRRDEIPEPPGAAFYRKLNALLAKHDFDRRAEALCAPYYARTGRPSTPIGVVIRMLLFGFLEGIGSQRGIAARCADSLSARIFLGCEITEPTPCHSTLSRTRQRLPLEVFFELFAMVVEIARKEGLLRGKTLGVDATFLEGNAALKSLQHKEEGESWKEFVRKIYMEENPEADEPTDDELRRFDRQRQDKRLSNRDWESPVDPDARIAKLKDGRTHMAYKAEHAVELGSGMILAAEVYTADTPDTTSIEQTLQAADKVAIKADTEPAEEVVADKGYHKAETLSRLQHVKGWRTYIPEKRLRHKRRWTDKPSEHEEAYRANRRRCLGARGKRLQRKRSVVCERTFAHVCDTGGSRRVWLRGLTEVRKWYLVRVMGYNLAVILRLLFGLASPRSLTRVVCLFYFVIVTVYLHTTSLFGRLGRMLGFVTPVCRYSALRGPNYRRTLFDLKPCPKPACATGC
ncbi:transposase [Thermostilla marina]